MAKVGNPHDIGDEFGPWVVLEIKAPRASSALIAYKYVCMCKVCGNKKVVSHYALKKVARDARENCEACAVKARGKDSAGQRTKATDSLWGKTDAHIAWHNEAMRLWR